MELNQFRDVDIVLDKANDNIIQKQFVSAGDKDGRSLTVQITDNGVIGELAGATLSLYWRNEASGLTDLSAFYVVDKATSVFKIDYPQNMLTPGKVIAYIQILHGGKVTHTKPFEITVQKLAGTTRGVLATAEYSALVTTLAKANEFETDIAKKADKEQVDVLGSEIDVARGGAQTLGERLDSEKAEVSAQLAKTVKRGENESITKNMLAQDIKEEINNGEINFILNTSEIEDNAVTPNKLDRTYADGKLSNYLDSNDIIENRYYNAVTGKSEPGNQTSFAFPKIELEIGKTYSLTTSDIFRFVFYNEDGSFSYSGTSSAFISPFTVQANQKHLGLAFFNRALTNLPMLVEGTELPNEYIPSTFVPKNLEYKGIKTAHLGDKVITPTKLDRTYAEGYLSNLLDKNDIKENKYYDVSNGGFYTGDGTTFAYPRIKLPAGKTFSLDTGELFTYVFHDSNNVMTSSGVRKNFINPFVPTEKETYLGVSYFNSRLAKPPTLVSGERVPEKYIEPSFVPKKLGVNTVEKDALSTEVLDLMGGGPQNLLVVGKDSVFKTIQSAIDSITDDRSDNAYIVLIMPGTYDRFTMLISPRRARHISLIGLDRESTIILSDTGHYDTPPAEIYTNGTIENLTFEMKTTAETFTGPSSQGYAYAVHDDYGANKNTLYKNCLFKSNAGPAVGSGTFGNARLQFHDCDFITTSDLTFGTNLLGAFFCHTNGTGMNQYAELINCRAINVYGVHGFKLHLIDSTGGSYNYYVQNSLSWGVDGAVAFVDEGILDVKSFGNNADSLNA